MLSSIKTNLENRSVITELTNKLQLGAENVVARIALGKSLAEAALYDPDQDWTDSKGKEYPARVLFGAHLPFYVGLVSQKYQLAKDHPDIPRLLKIHLDQGLQSLFSEYQKSNNVDSISFLTNYF